MLISRLISCARKSSRRPTASSSARARGTASRWLWRRTHLLGHVELVGQERDLGLEARRGRGRARRPRLAEAVAEALPAASQPRIGARASTSATSALDGVGAGDEVVGEGGALGAAHGLEAVERVVERGLRGRPGRRGVRGVGASAGTRTSPARRRSARVTALAPRPAASAASRRSAPSRAAAARVDAEPGRRRRRARRRRVDGRVAAVEALASRAPAPRSRAAPARAARGP